MPLKVNARSRSSDPVQEHLRERKQVWNKACSEFIARLNAFKPHLISFKRGLNGRGDPKAGLPISNIKDPLPTEVSSFLGGTSSEFGELASTFSALVSEANGIIQEQAEYASKRRKPQPRENRAPKPAPIVADIHENNDEIIVQGSNPLTRFWAHLSSFLSSDKNKTKRLSMLSQAHKLFQNLVKFEDHILDKGVKNVPSVLTSYFLVANNFKALQGSLKNMLPQDDDSKGTSTPPPPPAAPPVGKKPSDKQQTSAPPAEAPIKPNFDSWAYATDMSYESMKNNALQMAAAGFKDDDVDSLVELYSKYVDEKDERKLEMIQDRMHYLYQTLLKKAKKKFKKESEFSSDLNIEKFSSNDLSRLFKKYKHQFGIKEPSSATRMEIYELIRAAKTQIDGIMDLLEKRKLDSEKLVSKMAETDQLINQMQEPINILNLLYQDKYYESDANRRSIPLIDPASRYFTRQIRKDVDKPGW